MILTKALMLYFRNHFLPEDNQIEDPEFSPILTESFNGLPPSYLLTVHHDPLMDEGQKYAQLLKQHGVDLHHHHHTDLMHGFISYGGVCPRSKQAVEQAIDSLLTLIPKK